LKSYLEVGVLLSLSDSNSYSYSKVLGDSGAGDGIITADCEEGY
jgi:hypothetical protein